MIARIQGQLEALENSTALIRPENSGLTYAVLLPAFAAARLGGSLGNTITLETMAFLESQNQGASFTPRLAGFLNTADREFFELLVTCKGIGNRKALRAMTLDCASIAAAIADRDVALLQTLPEVGKRTAETIVATLRGKADRFATPHPSPANPADNSLSDNDSHSTDPDTAAPATHPHTTLGREALDILITLGENRVQAAAWIDEVLRDTDNRPADAQTLVQRIYTARTTR